MPYTIDNCRFLILAAGQSKRLGSSKQLLQYEGQTLINRLIGIIKKASSFPITVVLGANAENIKATIIKENVDIVINENWEEGMASSIRVGLEAANASTPNLDGIIILVCDQPFLTEESIRSLLELQKNSSLPIAACYYSNSIGTPALFHKSVFPELLALKGDTGARLIIKNRENEVAKLHFDKGVVDIDTLEDYNKLISGSL